MLSKNIKGRIGAVVTTIFLVIVMLTIYLTESTIEKISAFSSFISALATAIICLYTFKSVKEVIKSNNRAEENNKNTKEDNDSKNKKESFEKLFSILLQEHNNYLKKIIESHNPLYSIGYILKSNGHHSHSIIRGNVSSLFYKNRKYKIHDRKIIIKLKIWVDKNNKPYYEPTKIVIENSKLTLNEKHNYFYSPNDLFLVSTDEGVTYDCNYISDFISKRKTSHLKNLITKNEIDVMKIIRKSNETSINILSPYMRVIYHILKLINENSNYITNDKSYSNIIRSVIPYDILILVAINSMFFYKTKQEKEITRLSDIFLASDNQFKIHNDYYKYFTLLKKYDFFEHLTLDFNSIINKSTNVKLMFKKPFERKFLYLKNRKTSKLIIPCDVGYELKNIYHEFSMSLRNLDTALLVVLFYKPDSSVTLMRVKLMKSIINKENRTRIKLKKEKYISMGAYLKHKCIVLDRNFIDYFMDGDIIYISE
ncbi:MAG TPA: hypothetical protein DIT05_07425 [Morganella sp. (in: Bacteria)]|nr:hypothetical protein [Morganella sp. (in: enterobacteria)]